jgi:hypothetical protein
LLPFLPKPVTDANWRWEIIYIRGERWEPGLITVLFCLLRRQLSPLSTSFQSSHGEDGKVLLLGKRRERRYHDYHAIGRKLYRAYNYAPYRNG